MSENKGALRREMKERRNAAKDRSLRDGEICKNLFSVPEFSNGGSVFLYASFASEADTSRIADELIRRGRRIFYPRVNGTEMYPVEYVGQAFSPGPFGVREPIGERAEEIPEITVLPMLAADKRLFRLGYGGGFYDRYLCCRNTLKIGICYDFQLIDHIPAEECDVPADILVTDKRILYRNERR